jgi:hypothetical protein
MRRRTAISRRTVLQLASAAGTAAVAPTPFAADKPKFSTLDSEQADILMAVSRTLFPHDFLENDVYTGVVKTVDAKAASDTHIRHALETGLGELGNGFSTMSEVARESALAQMQGTEFFRILYDETLNGLYRNPEIARLLGDEGSSLEFGGFIERGFDDIDWLPDV